MHSFAYNADRFVVSLLAMTSRSPFLVTVMIYVIASGAKQSAFPPYGAKLLPKICATRTQALTSSSQAD
jgi:hypothetical protein